MERKNLDRKKRSYEDVRDERNMKKIEKIEMLNALILFGK